MCDERTAQETEAYLTTKAGPTRRDLAKIGLGMSFLAVLPACSDPVTVTEEDVVVKTPDGDADAYFVHPATGKHPGVIIWPDIMSLRPAFRAMGRRLAESGYSVLVINPYYRMAKAPVIEPGQGFRDPEVREKIMPFARSLTAETNVTDAKAFAAFLDAQPSVDTSKPIGTTGYCMGGPMVLRTAAALPERIGAAASFHGGGLVTDSEASPHLLIPQMQAGFLIAIAANDDESDQQAKTTLKETFEANNLKAEIEVYEGAMHGWCPPDSAVYNETQAEKAWSRLLVLFEKNLA